MLNIWSFIIKLLNPPPPRRLYAFYSPHFLQKQVTMEQGCTLQGSVPGLCPGTRRKRVFCKCGCKPQTVAFYFNVWLLFVAVYIPGAPSVCWPRDEGTSEQCYSEGGEWILFPQEPGPNRTTTSIIQQWVVVGWLHWDVRWVRNKRRELRAKTRGV